MSNVFDLSGNVIPLVLPEGTLNDIPVEAVCESAKKCTEVLIVGWDPEGNLYMAGSSADTGGHMLLLELAKDDILSRHR